MAAKTHKKTERGDHFEFGFCCPGRVKTIPALVAGKAFCFVPLVPFGGHASCGI
jgi:hypothetical protein